MFETLLPAAQTQNDIVYSWPRCIYVSKESWHRVSWPLTRLVIIFLLLFGSAGTGRKSTWAMTTRWPWLSTPGTRVREGRTRQSCMWCSPPKLTTAVFTAIMRWLEMQQKPLQLPVTNTRLWTWFNCFSITCSLLWFDQSVLSISEPDPADLQLRVREPDPIPQLRFGQPNEVWYQCKDTFLLAVFGSLSVEFKG